MILSFASVQAGGPLPGAAAWDYVLAAPALLSFASLLALMAYACAAALPATSVSRWRAALWLAWGAHAMALLAAVNGWGLGLEQPGARFGFAPALSATLWLVLAVYILESGWLPAGRLRRAVALCAALTVALAWVFPGEVRSLASSRWATVHWVLAVASYGLLGAAVFHAMLLDRADRRLRQKELPIDEPGISVLMLEGLTFRFVLAGFFTLTLALVLGALLPSGWRWDHKVVFSLLGWLVFAGLLLGRHFMGWRGRQATRWLYLGAALLLLAYVGSRFVFEVLLHRSGPV
jgi:ABC-type uncharacterized transport system permease subunit